MSTREHIRTTCPRDCYDGCGIVVVKRDGAVTKVLGDPEHEVSRGALCGKCALAYNGAWRDPDQRLLYPLRRSGPKGSGQFERVSWDEALAEIAARLGTLVSAGEAASILTAHYTGTCSVIANAFPMRFFNHIGASEVDPDSICNAAGHQALNLTIGTSATGFDPRTAKDAAAILVWGANPSASAPHAHKHWLPEAPGSVVVIDPIRTPSAEQADIHLQLRPGSDAALAFAMAHIAWRDGLLDRDYIARATLGYDELEPAIRDVDLAWAAAETGLDMAAIEQVARLYATGPSLLWLGQALQRQPGGGNIFRACATLPALTGNIGKPGAGLYFLNGKGMRGIRTGDIGGAKLRAAAPAMVSHMDLVERLEDVDASKALVLWNINIAASNPRQAALRRALRRESLFTVVIDLFQTDSADHADLVLPAASFLEFDDLAGSYMHLTLGAQSKAMEPLGEALPNQEIFRRIARAMGLAEPALFEPDDAIIDRILERAPIEIDFATLKQRGTVTVLPDVLIPFADAVFPTPSGRIELASAAAEALGLPRLPQARVDAPPADGLLRLLSPASAWHMNSSYDNDAAIARRRGAAEVTLNPRDAADRGLVAEQTVRLANPTGSLEARLSISDMVPPGTAYAPKGRWPKLDAQSANVNALYDGAPADMARSTAVHGTHVWIEPVIEN